MLDHPDRHRDLWESSRVIATGSSHVRWEADPPGALTPQVRIADDDESKPTPELVTTQVVGYLACAPAAWDPFVAR
jgi:hypothetical protein